MVVATRVVVADDAPLIREAIGAVLDAAGCEVVAQVGDAAALLAAVAAHRPCAAVVDIRMPPSYRLEGLHAAARIRRSHPEVGVLLLSQYVETHHLRELLGGGPRGVGYLLKERVAGSAAFVDAVRRVARGGYAFDPDVVAPLIERAGRDGGADGVTALSEREREVLALMAQGRSNHAICQRLQLTGKTVESHVRSIFVRLGLQPETDDNRRVLAVLAYLRAGPAPYGTRG